MNDRLAKNIKTRRHINSAKAQVEFVIEGLLIGLVAGMVAILYRFLLTLAEKGLFFMLPSIKQNPLYTALWFLVLVILGLIVGKLVKWESMISGSGIPQVSGEMKGYLDPDPVRVLFAKIAGGTLSILGGLSLGREGPSIQLGAMAAKKLSRITGRGKTKEKTFVSCGAGAGLAAAFNAPLAGAMFTLEEIHKNFDGRIIVSVMVATITADFTSKVFFGKETVFSFGNVRILPLRMFWVLVLLGIILGLCGALYNSGMLLGQKAYRKMTFLKDEYKTIIPFVIAGGVALFMPDILCGGNRMVAILNSGDYVLSALIVLLIMKFVFSAVCFGSGTPGGIFYPLLVLGAFIGASYGTVITEVTGLDYAYMTAFIILSMAGFFAATVRAPITGIILIFEMTGSLEYMISITLVSIVAYVVAYLCGSKPIYESLLENILETKGIKTSKSSDETMLVTYNVTFGSRADGKRIDELEWPLNSLVVAIERGGHEFIPRGYNNLMAGDFVTVLISEDEQDFQNELMVEMMCQKEVKEAENYLPWKETEK